MRCPLKRGAGFTGKIAGRSPLTLREIGLQEGLIPSGTQDKTAFIPNSGGHTGEFTKPILSDSFDSEATVKPAGNSGFSAQGTQIPSFTEIQKIPDAHRVELFRNQNASTFAKLKRAEALSLASQVAGMAILLSVDVWETGQRPLADWKGSLRRAWTTAPDWDDDDIEFNYIGHPYTGAFTYNLMRSQNSSPLASWLFSCSQSLIWEYTIEALEEHPSMQDLLITSNVGSLMGEGFHRITMRMKKNGFTLPEKIIVSIINPGYVLNNGYQ